MPAVKEAPRVTKEINSSNWQMPPIQTGESVVWYMDGDVHGSKPTAALVVEVSGRAISCLLQRYDGRQEMRRDVHFRDDPRLEENAHIRQLGCWDYGPQHRRIADLESRIAVLEDLVTKK